MEMKEFPFETYLPIEGEEHFMGRIVVNKLGRKFSAEVDIINTESHKIFQHVTNLYELDDPKETLDLAVQKLSRFLQGKKDY